MNVMDKWNENGLGRPVERTVERARTAQLAHQLSTVALQQWEKTLTGLVALPAAAALGVAATATYSVALLERNPDPSDDEIQQSGDRHRFGKTYMASHLSSLHS